MKTSYSSAAASSIPTLAAIFFTTTAMAGEFDFEVEAAYDLTQFNGRQTITTQGGTIFNSSASDTDDLSLSGSWFFSGMSDDKGPRARAIFVDRASSVSIGYSRLDQSVSTFLNTDDPQFSFPDIDGTFNTNGDSFAVDVRYVDRSTGWFGDVGVLATDVAISGFVDDSIDASGWRLGVGKYLFGTTALGLNYSQVDADGGGDAEVIALFFTHLGDLGSRWQYAIDLGYARTEAGTISDLDTWNAAISLYPTRDFEFGVAIEDVSDDRDFQGFFETRGISGFASWFVTPNVKLAARYRVDDVNYFGSIIIGGAPRDSDANQDSFGLSMTIRF